MTLLFHYLSTGGDLRTRGWSLGGRESSLLKWKLKKRNPSPIMPLQTNCKERITVPHGDSSGGSQVKKKEKVRL